MGNFLSGVSRAIQDLSGVAYYGTGMVTTAHLGTPEFLQVTEHVHNVSAWLYFYGPMTIVYLVKVLKRSTLVITAVTWFVKKLKQLFTRR